MLSLQAVEYLVTWHQRILLDSDSGPDGGESSSSSVEAKEQSEAFEKTVDLQSTTEEVEKSLEELGSNIEETINKSGAVSSKEPEPPHFTIATSPTRRTLTHKDEY